jgi:hypothetical protein
VTDDVAATTFAEDSYFGGKSLARAADLLLLAEQLGADDAAATLRDRLSTELRTWAEPSGCDTRAAKCFVYDSETGGVVGQQPAFGSEQFNDHHFHYGYFLYAAALVSADDRRLRDDLAPMMTVLAADLASGSASSSSRCAAPSIRTPATPGPPGPRPSPTGTTRSRAPRPFAPGTVSGSGRPSPTTRPSPTRPPGCCPPRPHRPGRRGSASIPPPSLRRLRPRCRRNPVGRQARLRDLVQYRAGGRARDPAHPDGGVSGYLAGDPERIRSNVAEALEGGPAPQFADLILMYQSMAGPDDAAAALSRAGPARHGHRRRQLAEPPAGVHRVPAAWSRSARAADASRAPYRSTHVDTLGT